MRDAEKSDTVGVGCVGPTDPQVLKMESLWADLQRLTAEYPEITREVQLHLADEPSSKEVVPVQPAHKIHVRVRLAAPTFPSAMVQSVRQLAAQYLFGLVDVIPVDGRVPMRDVSKSDLRVGLQFDGYFNQVDTYRYSSLVTPLKPDSPDLKTSPKPEWGRSFAITLDVSKKNPVAKLVEIKDHEKAIQELLEESLADAVNDNLKADRKKRKAKKVSR